MTALLHFELQIFDTIKQFVHSLTHTVHFHRFLYNAFHLANKIEQLS